VTVIEALYVCQGHHKLQGHSNITPTTVITAVMESKSPSPSWILQKIALILGHYGHRSNQDYCRNHNIPVNANKKSQSQWQHATMDYPTSRAILEVMDVTVIKSLRLQCRYQTICTVSWPSRTSQCSKFSTNYNFTSIVSAFITVIFI
jgi:hypothetical protein